MPRKLTQQECLRWLKGRYPQGNLDALLRVIEATQKARPEFAKYFQAFKLYWGLEGGNLTLAQVGERMNVSAQSAKAMRERAEHILAHPDWWK